MTSRLQGNIAILTGYLLYLAATVNPWLALALVVVLVLVVSAYRLRRNRYQPPTR